MENMNVVERTGKIHFADRSGMLVLNRLTIGRGEFGRHHLIWMLPDSKHRSVSQIGLK